MIVMTSSSPFYNMLTRLYAREGQQNRGNAMNVI